MVDQDDAVLMIQSVTSVNFLSHVLKAIAGTAIENYIIEIQDRGDLSLVNAFIRTTDKRRHMFTYYGWRNGHEEAGSTTLADQEFEMLIAI